MGQLDSCESPRAMTRNTAQATKPTPHNGTVLPSPVPHAQRRPREYLTPKEVERLITAARQNRYGHRDATLIPIAYSHGLRIAELCTLRWDQEFSSRAGDGTLHCTRLNDPDRYETAMHHFAFLPCCCSRQNAKFHSLQPPSL